MLLRPSTVPLTLRAPCWTPRLHVTNPKPKKEHIPRAFTTLRAMGPFGHLWPSTISIRWVKNGYRSRIGFRLTVSAHPQNPTVLTPAAQSQISTKFQRRVSVDVPSLTY